MLTIDQRTALGVLTKPRLLAITAALELGLPDHWLKSEIVGAIAASPRAPFLRILQLLRREELKAICRAAAIDDYGREKAKIADRILVRSIARGVDSLTKADLIEDVGAATGSDPGPAGNHPVTLGAICPVPWTRGISGQGSAQ